MRVGMAPSEAPLFISPRGTPVVRSDVVKAIKWLAERSGLPAAEFAGHSLYIGTDGGCFDPGDSGPGEMEIGFLLSVPGGPGLLPDTASGQNGTIGPRCYLLGGPPDYARPWTRGSPGWTTGAHNPCLRLTVPEAGAAWPIPVPNAGAGQVVEAGRGLGFYGG